MSKKFDKTHLVVSGLGGTVFIADVTKTLHLMSTVRKEVPLNEWYAAIIDWLKKKFPETICEITQEGEPVAELTLIRDAAKHKYHYKLLEAILNAENDEVPVSEIKHRIKIELSYHG